MAGTSQHNDVDVYSQVEFPWKSMTKTESKQPVSDVVPIFQSFDSSSSTKVCLEDRLRLHLSLDMSIRVRYLEDTFTGCMISFFLSTVMMLLTHQRATAKNLRRHHQHIYW